MLFQEFKDKIQRLAQETAMMSFTDDRHPLMRELIEANPPIAWICLMLANGTIHQAFYLFSRFIPADKHPPIPEYYSGRIPVVLACYRYWALKEGHVSIKYNPQRYWVEDKDGNAGDWH